MDSIVIKKKNYEILEIFDEHTFKITFKNKICLAKKFNDVKIELKNYVKSIKFLANCGLNVPKIILIDKKSGFVLSEYIEGKSAFEALCEGELPEAYYKGIFAMAFRCKLERINLDFSPMNFILMNDKLYYMSTICHPYKEEENFINKSIRHWFYTLEFVELLKEKDLPIDRKRLKVEYAINKEIVLTTVKYYM